MFSTNNLQWLLMLVEKRVQDRKRDIDGRLVYHETRLSSVAVCYELNVWLRGLHDRVAGTQKAFDEERPTLFLVALSFLF